MGANEKSHLAETNGVGSALSRERKRVGRARTDRSWAARGALSTAERSLVLNTVIVVATAVGYFIVAFRETLVPANFSYDGRRIQGIARGTVFGYGDPSYEVVAGVYRSVGLADNDFGASLVGYSLLVFTVGFARYRFRDVHSLPASCFTFTAALLLGALYLGYYSKDVFVLPIVLLPLALGFSRRTRLAMMSMMIAYGLMFRPYWLLIAAGFLAFTMFRLASMRSRTAFFLLVVSSVLLSMAIYIFLGLDPSHFRQTANESRIGSEDATTAIRSLIAGPQPIAGAANVLLSTFMLLFPVPLLSIGNVFYVGVFFAISAMWMVTFRAFRRLPVDSRNQEPVIVASSLLAAFVIVQGVFEPDYGSALRHLTPLLPLILILTSAPRDSEVPQ